MSEASNAAVENGAQPSFPLFYQQPEVLRPEVHGELELRPEASYEFARVANAIPINTVEFALAARDYPIVFAGLETPMPLALVGLRKDQNLMVDEKGAWEPHAYVPAYVRRYPFIFVQNDEANQLTLCIDGVSDRIAKGSEFPFFVDEEPADVTNEALKFCTSFQQGANATNAVCMAIAEHGLLKRNSASFTLDSGEVVELKDFSVVDQTKLNELSDDAFTALRKTGALPIIYCQLISMNSWGNLIRRA